jgi:hypothetical protein
MWRPKLGPAALTSDTKVLKKRWLVDQNHWFLWFESQGLTLSHVLSPWKSSAKKFLPLKINREVAKVPEVWNNTVLAMVLFLKENKRDFSLVNLHPESPEVETVASNLSANLRANSL